MCIRDSAKINNGDTVYILGDMAMRGKNSALLALVAQLKGKKILFRGNHDDLSLSLIHISELPLERRVRRELEKMGLTKAQEDACVEIAVNAIPVIKRIC